MSPLRPRHTERRRATALAVPAAVLLLAVGAPGAQAGTAASCGPVDVGPAQAGAAASEAAVSCLVDRERAAAGLAPLADAAPLQSAARDHSADMVRRGFFSHDAPGPLGTPMDRVLRRGYVVAQIGENIASGQPTPSAVVAAWVSSPSHCVNLFDPRLTEDGVGVDPGGTAGTSGPTWTHELGRRQMQPPGRGTAPACGRTPLDPAVDVPAFASAAPEPAPVREPAPVAAPGPDAVFARSPARPTLRATARRSGRVLRLRVQVGGVPRAKVRIAVRQGRRTVHLTRLVTGRARTASVRLRSKAPGRAVVAGAGLTRTVRFR